MRNKRLGRRSEFRSDVLEPRVLLSGALVAVNDSYTVLQNLNLDQTGITALYFNGNDYIYSGTNTWTPSDGAFSIINDSGHNGVYINADSQLWTLDFAAVAGQTLQPGTYTNVERSPFQDSTHPGMDIGGDGRGLDSETGQFTVLQLTYNPDGTVASFAATFAQQEIYPAGRELDGHIYYHYKPSGYQSGVLNNDTGPTGASLSALQLSAPQHGTVSLSADGSFVYSPAQDYTGPDSFTYEATDGQNVSNVATVTLNVQVDVANPGGPYTVNEGSSVSMDGSYSTTHGGISNYAWDFNYDGNPADFVTQATGEYAAFDASALDGPSVVTVGYRVTNIDGVVGLPQTTSVTINNVPPTATPSALSYITLGQTGVAGLTTPQDPSIADTSAGFTYSYDFNDDGTFEITNSPLSSAIVPASYLSTLGSHPIDVRISDKDGGYTDYVETIVVIAPSTGTISGRVFDDYNGDGIEQSTETGQAGIVVYLDLRGDATLDPTDPTTTTLADGSFVFNTVQAGGYTVRMLIPSGSYAPGGSNAVVNVTAGSTASLTFGLTQYGVISGSVFNDVTGSGFFIPNSPLPSVTVFLDANGNGVLDAGDPSAVSDASGNYTIGNLKPGSFDLREVVPVGYAITQPQTAYYRGYYTVNIFSGYLSPVETFGDHQTPAIPLAGTVIGTSGSYKNDGNTAAKAFDGNINTFFDGPAASGNWVGLDLGSAKVITSLAYVSRSGWASRMNGGVFQASSSASFSSGVVNLYTIASNANPLPTVFTTQLIGNTVAYQYVRYYSPANSYGNVAEIEFFGKAPVVTPDSISGVVTGAAAGTTIYLDANNNSQLDGSEISTTTTANGSYSFSNVPATSYVIRQVLSNGYTQTSPIGNTGLSITVSSGSTFTSENFVDQPTATLTQFKGTTIGTPGSYDNDGNTISKATDGNVSTFFDGPTANGDWVGLDFGSIKVVKQIKYAPRSGFASRMVGGIIQTSNSSNFSSGVVNLYTITSTPTQNVLTTINLSNTTAYRYYRYLSPNGGYGNISEFELFG